MRSKTSGRFRLLVLVAVAATFAATACGSAELTKEEAEAELHKSQQQAQLDFAKCLRDKGIDVRDPAPEKIGLGFINPPEAGVNAEEQDEAAAECRREMADQLEAAELAETGDEETQDLLLAYAGCMRERGIDMPDPDFSKPRSGPGAYFDQWADFGDEQYEDADGYCRAKYFTTATGHSGGEESGPGGDEEKPSNPDISPGAPRGERFQPDEEEEEAGN